VLSMGEPKRGRPPLEPGKQSVSVTVKLGPSLYDRICVRAIREGVSVPELLRRPYMDDDEDDDF
jgi:hypothetical protein